MLKATSNRWDSFTYDNFDRLTSWQDASGTEVMNYNRDGSLNNAPGNGLGNYTYTNYSRYVFNGCGGSTGAINYIAHPVNITYNMFKDPILITRIDGYNSYAKFEYNLSYQRSYDSNWSAGGYFNEGRYYSEGNIVEVRFVNSSTYKFITYLDGDPYSARVIHIKQSADYWNPYTNGAINDYFYLHRDNQATIIAISNSSGIIAERRFFDAWGNLKSGGIYLTYRGYTGHEHFNLVNLIHCNARLYDPIRKMFLTPDNVLQDPYDPQNYNRFGYCLNNPLKYTDPSGNFIPFFIIPSFSIDNNGSIGFSLSFVLGIPHALNVSATIGYAGGQGYITAGVQGGGAYAYIGYGGQSGWMAGVGFSFLPPGAAGNFSVGTNIGSVGLSWSEFGGVSANSLGFFISSRGVDFNPSISISTMAYSGKIGNRKNISFTKLSSDEIDNLNANQGQLQNDLDEVAKAKYGADYKTRFGVKSLKWGSQLTSKEKEEINATFGSKVTYNSKIKLIYASGEAVGGFTTPDGRIFISDIYINSTVSYLQVTLGHEFIHAYHHMFFGSKYNQSNSEYSSYQFSIDFSIKYNSIDFPNNGITQQTLNDFQKFQSDYIYNSNYRYQLIPGFKF